MESDFQRQNHTELLAWKNAPKRKPLIIRGARQVGKTTAIRQFGATFRHYIELNLEKEEHLRLIDQSERVQQLADALSLMHNIPLSDWPETLLFIDEIQESPKAIALLRYFYEELPQLHVVAAGSLLEHSLGAVQHFPVGRVSYLYMFPLNFPEFLIATNQGRLLDRLENIPIDDIAHPILLKAFHTFCIIGGMPEIVADYARHGDMTRLPPIYESIWNTYKDDVAKYAGSATEQKVIRHIMNTAPALVDKRVKFENFGHSNYRSREVGEAFQSLDQAKVVQIIYPTTETEPPALADQKKSPRLQLLDTGLLNFDLNLQADLLLLQDLSDSYRGAIIPHLITQEIISLNKTSYQKPSFWVRDKTQSSAEVDLVRVCRGLLIPIEIKSGAAGRLRSLHQFIDRAPHAFAVRMYAGKFSVEKQKTPDGKAFYLMNLPYYLGTYLDRYLAWFVENQKDPAEQ